MISFLEYLGTDNKHAEDDFRDAYVQQLQQTVAKIKSDREMGVRYMLFSELLKYEYSAGVMPVPNIILQKADRSKGLLVSILKLRCF